MHRRRRALAASHAPSKLIVESLSLETITTGRSESSLTTTAGKARHVRHTARYVSGFEPRSINASRPTGGCFRDKIEHFFFTFFPFRFSSVVTSLNPLSRFYYDD